MAVIRHVKSITIADGTDANKLQPSNWNSDHAFTLVDGVTLGGNTAGVAALVSSGTLLLAGGNNITLSQNGNSVTISGGAGGGLVTHNSVYHSGNIFPQNSTQYLGSQPLDFGEFQSTNVPGSPAAGVARLYAYDRFGRNVLRYKTPAGNEFQLSQDNVMVVRNETGVAIPIFTPVYEVGTGAGGEPLVAPANAVSEATMPAIGILVESIANGANGFVMLSGVLTGINTSGFSVGDVIYVAVGGGLATVTPVIPNVSQRIARILTSAVNGTVLVLSRGERNTHKGSIENEWIIGNGTNGTKQVLFRGGADYALQVSHTAARTARLPDKTGTIAFLDDIVAQTVESNTLGMSNLGNTLGTSGVVSGGQVRMIFAGGNNVTLSQSINGASGTITISGPTVPTQTVESQTLGVSNLGNTIGTSGVISGGQVRMLFAGGNNVTLSQSINGASATITVSGANIPTQTVESNTFGMSNLGNTVGTSGVVSGGQVRILFAGGNNVTLSQSINGSSATITVSGANIPAQTVQAQSFTLGGNTQGQSTVTGSQISLFGGNNITLSAGNGSITVIGGAGGAAGTNTFGMSNLGNTSGTSGTINGTGVQLLFAGGNGITLSQSINGSSATITISGGAGGAAGSNTFGMSNLGNTSGTSGVVSGSAIGMYLAGGSNITLSQSINGSNVTISISAPSPGGGAVPSLRWEQMPLLRYTLANITNITALNGIPFYTPFKIFGNLTVSRANFEMSRSTSGSNNFTALVGVYSYVNDTQISLHTSFSGLFSNTATASISGIRRFGVLASQSFSLTPGGYVLGMVFTAANTLSMNYSIRGGMTASPQVGAINEGSDQYNTATSWNIFPFYGRHSAVVSSLAGSVGDNQVRGQFSGASSPIPAWIGLNND